MYRATVTSDLTIKEAMAMPEGISIAFEVTVSLLCNSTTFNLTKQ